MSKSLVNALLLAALVSASGASMGARQGPPLRIDFAKGNEGLSIVFGASAVF